MGVHLPKTESLTDWSRRPLDPEQLVYADDVATFPISIGVCVSVCDHRLGCLTGNERYTAPGKFQRDPKEAIFASNDQTHSKTSNGACPRNFVPGEKNVRLSTHSTKWIIRTNACWICQRSPATSESSSRIRGTESLSQESVASILAAIKWAGAFRQKSVLSPYLQPSRNRIRRRSLIDACPGKDSSKKREIAPQLIANKTILPIFSPRKRLQAGGRWQTQGLPFLYGEVGLTVKCGHVEPSGGIIFLVSFGLM